jgi:serine/threonine protein phosphatase 1
MVQCSLIQKLPSNAIGRDFVIGDLHGCFDLLESLMKAVDFNIHQDRLFSVGDLIDRGPFSLRCLQLITEPWFYAVMGNHETMMLDYFEVYLQKGYIGSDFDFDESDEIGYLLYGGEWVKDYYQLDNGTMSKAFDHGLELATSLPLLIVVGENDQRFHIVHSELLRPDYSTNEIKVWLDSNIDQWLSSNAMPDGVKERFYWGRTLMEGHLNPVPQVQEGLSVTFCGHTIGKNIRQKLSHICLDTGAYASAENGGNSLTIYDSQAKQWISASYYRSDLTYGAMAL